MTAKANPAAETVGTLRSMVSDSASRIASIGAQGAEQYQDAAASVNRQVRRMRDDLADLRYSMGRNARSAARAADEYVHANPWKSAGTAAAVAALAVAAFLIATRRD